MQISRSGVRECSWPGWGPQICNLVSSLAGSCIMALEPRFESHGYSPGTALTRNKLVAGLGFFSPTLPWHLLIPQLQVAWLQPGTNCCCLPSNWHSPGVRLILQAGSLTHGSDSARMLFRDLHFWMFGNHETSPWLPFFCSFQHLPKLPSFNVLVTEVPFSPTAHILYSDLSSMGHGTEPWNSHFWQ